MSEQYDLAVKQHPIYKQNKKQWRYLFESYIGGDVYRNGHHLTKYKLESDNEYLERLKATPLDNHCDSVISIYNGFMFRKPPMREYGSLENLSELNDFIQDTDHDGRNIDAFMKEVATWSSVYGHSWVLVVKPNVEAVTRADEMALGVRPYLTILSPLAVLDWEFKRQVNGAYHVEMLKYVEEVNGNFQTLKVWTMDEIQTIVVNTDKEELVSVEVEVNGLGRIPAITAYNKKSTVNRGIGISDVRDIADEQRFIYNLNSEMEQSIRLDSHPSLVKTKDTQAGIGPGSLIEVPEDMDPALKPYILEFSGASVSSILSAVEKSVNTIDKMANVGAIRSTEAQRASGVAQQQEFELLNARLTDKANNLALAEEQIWKLFALYMGKEWDGTIKYPDSFNVKDVDGELNQLQTAMNATTDTNVETMINRQLVEALGENPDDIIGTDDSNNE